MYSYEFDIRHLVGVALALIAFSALRSGRLVTFLRGLKPEVLRIPPHALLFSLLTLGLFFRWDQVVLDAVQRTAETFPAWKRACDLLTKNSHVWFFLCALYLLGVLRKNEFLTRAGFGGILASGLASGVGTILKFIFLRARPYDLSGSHSFFNFHGIEEHAYQSLPSGDVALIAGFSCFWFFSARSRMLKAFFLLLPFATAFSRIADNKHWPSDTLISIFLGLLAGLMIQRSLQRTPVSA